MKSFEVTMWFEDFKVVTTEHGFIDGVVATGHAVCRCRNGIPTKTSVKEVEFCRLVWDN